ncbi:MAG: Nramp family divalent metal transporter [Planctomycetales bacterium]|nr:Nramp family divalent metal transporter [Planctomycetales bacterium]
MAESERDAMLSQTQAPPHGFMAILRQLGPGLIIAASIVGSGELIVTTSLGAKVGFTLLWFIILGCLLKVLVQIEFGRYALAHRETTLQALDKLPGPRLKVGWLIYLWLFMYVATFCQVAGMIGALADAFRFAGATWNSHAISLLIALSCSLLLIIGKYRMVERTSTTMVAAFTVFTIFAVGGLYWTDYPITMQDIMSGLSFQLPQDGKFTTAFAAFGIIGVGASELIFYPYWCLEKGYGRSVGANDGSPEWADRARGWMRVLEADAWVSMLVYTGATIAFYLLGAAVLHGKSVQITNAELIPSLSHMYLETFGKAGLWIFLVGAFIVLYSTVFIATASNARLFADLMAMIGVIRDRESSTYQNVIRLACGLLPVLYFVILVYIARPLDLVYWGALSQAFMLPALCIAALYFHHYRMEYALATSSFWTAMLWIAAILMTCTGFYQAYTTLLN